MTATQTQLDAVTELARQLSSVDQVRLIARLAAELEQRLPTPPKPPTKSLFGILRDLGPAPSEEDIAEIRREMWANFPRDDIAP